MNVRKYCHNLCLRMFFPIFLFRNFMVSFPIFRSLNHFEFVFVCGVFSNFTGLYIAVQLSLHPTLVEETFFFPLYLLASFVV